MRSKETVEKRNNRWDIFFSSLDFNCKKTVLRCLIDIADSFQKHEHRAIPMHAITSPIINLEKNLGHNSIPFVLESMGVAIDSDILSFTSDPSHITENIQRMHTMLLESEANKNEYTESQILSNSTQHFAKRIRQLDI